MTYSSSRRCSTLPADSENPFAFLLIVPVAVSASTQRLTVTSLLAGFTVVLATVLARYHDPLPWTGAEQPILPMNYMLGLWSALVSCIVFIAIYAWRIEQEAWQMAQALSAAELVLAREQRLTALDGLAAAAAHQLGTPLSTIVLVAKELEREVPKNTAIHDDVVLLQTQAARCREILSQLSKSGREGEEDIIFSKCGCATSSRRSWRRFALPAWKSTSCSQTARLQASPRPSRSLRATPALCIALSIWSRTPSNLRASGSRSTRPTIKIGS